MNKEDQPVCKKHKDNEPKEVGCPECGFPMEVREGKYGYFWGCTNFPACENTLSIKQQLKREKFKDDDKED